MAPDDDVTDPASLPTARRQLVERRSITGESARALARAIAVRAFEDDAGRIHFVWADYGRLARPLRIRARSEATCDLGNQTCSIDTTLLFFIDYDEHHECGYLAKSQKRF